MARRNSIDNLENLPFEKGRQEVQSRETTKEKLIFTTKLKKKKKKLQVFLRVEFVGRRGQGGNE